MFSNLEILLNNKWYAGNKNIICKIKSKHLGMSLSVTTKITYVILRKMVDPKRLSNCINCRHSILKYNILSCLGLLSENSWAFTYRTHLANLLVITLWKNIWHKNFISNECGKFTSYSRKHNRFSLPPFTRQLQFYA